jgi:hypothetical protein
VSIGDEVYKVCEGEGGGIAYMVFNKRFFGCLFDKNSRKVAKIRAKTREIDWYNFYCPNPSHSGVIVETPFVTKTFLHKVSQKPKFTT